MRSLVLTALALALAGCGTSGPPDGAATSPAPAAFEFDLVAHQLKLLCEARARQTPEAGAGVVVFDDLHQTSVGFEVLEGGGEAFAWVSGFSVNGRRYTFSCTGTGAGPDIRGWQVEYLDLLG